MKRLSIIAFLFCLIAISSPTQAQPSLLLIANDILVDTTFTTNLLFAGVIIHASAANATVLVYNNNSVIFRWKEPVDEKSSGIVFAAGGIKAGTSLWFSLTNCTATTFRRRE